MSESLVLRVKRLVSGSVNGLVDALETANPEMVMREATREIENALDEVRSEQGRVIAARHQTTRLIEKTKAKLGELTERAHLAIEEKREDLAEAALSRQLELETQIPEFEAKLASFDAKQAELDGYIAALDARRRDMAADIEAFVTARETASEMAGIAGEGASVAAKAERRADKAQEAFDRVNGSAGASGAKRADRETAYKLQELDRLTHTRKVAERLASLKSKVRAG